MTTGLRRLQLDHARLYDHIRTAHLERAHRLPPATIVYGSKRYDFDERLAVGLDLVHAGAAAAAALIARSRIAVLEINEPFNIAANTRTALVLGALGARTIFTRKKPLVVTYAIENMSPFGSGAQLRLSTRIRRRVERILVRFIWRRVDRVAYGTGAARALYRDLLPASARREESLVPALPEPCSCAAAARRSHDVVFLGALSDRKGFPQLLRAWPLVRERDPEVRLVILGKGKLEGLAREAARSDASIEVLIDPPREEIHRRLRASQVLTLPSQRTSTWR
ncbi:MAG: hypothetical protein QOH55_1818, partial [Microbacteriaceae bacterium]|nr:hypothetical protein [Microbacteriaceae bacterium]